MVISCPAWARGLPARSHFSFCFRTAATWLLRSSFSLSVNEFTFSISASTSAMNSSSPGPGGASTTSVVATLIGEYTVFSLNFWIEPEAIIDASVFFKPL